MGLQYILLSFHAASHGDLEEIFTNKAIERMFRKQ